jgi:hypothetical protein
MYKTCFTVKILEALGLCQLEFIEAYAVDSDHTHVVCVVGQ